MTAGSLVVGDIAGRRSGDAGDVLRGQAAVLGPVEWNVEVIVEVLGKFVILVYVSLDDHAVLPG
ncbi:MAG: hypothetical protein ACM37V_15545 [Gemmatimonadota bacterium]